MAAAADTDRAQIRPVLVGQNPRHPPNTGRIRVPRKKEQVTSSSTVISAPPFASSVKTKFGLVIDV